MCVCTHTHIYIFIHRVLSSWVLSLALDPLSGRLALQRKSLHQLMEYTHTQTHIYALKNRVRTLGGPFMVICWSASVYCRECCFLFPQLAFITCTEENLIISGAKDTSRKSCQWTVLRVTKYPKASSDHCLQKEEDHLSILTPVLALSAVG